MSIMKKVRLSITMKNKKIWWIAAGVSLLLLALIIAIVSTKETPEIAIEESPLIESPETDIDAAEPVEPEIQVDTDEDYSQPEPTEQPLITPEEPKKEQSTKPSTQQPNAAPVKPTETAPKPTPPQQTKPEAVALITDGTYQVGSDIEAGEYLVFSNGVTLLENTKDQSGNPDSIIFNIALDGRSHTYVTLLQGEYFKLQGGEMYPVASAPDLKPSNGVYKDGQYKIGKDLPAGNYTLLVEDKSDIGFYEISKNSRQDMMDMLVSDVVESELSVSLTNGQYLTIRNAYIEVK